jgi:hypothetical protein
LKSEYQDDNDDSMSVHESIVDESQGRRKEFEVSIVEIVPHISPGTWLINTGSNVDPFIDPLQEIS